MIIGQPEDGDLQAIGARFHTSCVDIGGTFTPAPGLEKPFGLDHVGEGRDDGASAPGVDLRQAHAGSDLRFTRQQIEELRRHDGGFVHELA
jgi:hypothetical protein